MIEKSRKSVLGLSLMKSADAHHRRRAADCASSPQRHAHLNRVITSAGSTSSPAITDPPFPGVFFGAGPVRRIHSSADIDPFGRVSHHRHHHRALANGTADVDAGAGSVGELLIEQLALLGGPLGGQRSALSSRTLLPPCASRRASARSKARRRGSVCAARTTQ